MLALRIIEKLLIIYFGLYLLADLLMYFYALFYFIFKRRTLRSEPDFSSHPITIVVPAYNEEVTVATAVENLLGLNYPSYEVVVVNDGSTDATLERLVDRFGLRPVEDAPLHALHTAPVRRVYGAPGLPLRVIDKDNGGKADAINAGLNRARGDYVCTVDADSVLDRDALREVIRPMIEDPAVMIGGGQLAVANGTVIENNRVVNARMPRNLLVIWQIVEYIKSFMISRLAFSRINALLIMSGAFSMFRKKDLLAAGGFLSPLNRNPYILETVGEGARTVCEDMEIVVRLWRYKRDLGQKAKVRFVPEAVCWTEVPESPRNLFKQRARWHQGLGETLRYHRAMIFEPKYGATGMIGMPYYLFFEFLSPAVKLSALIFLIVAARAGLLHLHWVLLLLLGIMVATALITATLTLILEYWASRRLPAMRDALRYKTFGDWLRLVGAGIASEFTYAFFKIIAQLKGIWQFVRGNAEWKKFERKGFQKMQA
ncbi:MAG: glycosyltransferase family 2 protein [Chlorobi bacterium]|nr:glycosyltransferase family 2 protein [Chlorobiota bacterium]